MNYLKPRIKILNTEQAIQNINSISLMIVPMISIGISTQIAVVIGK